MHGITDDLTGFVKKQVFSDMAHILTETVPLTFPRKSCFEHVEVNKPISQLICSDRYAYPDNDLSSSGTEGGSNDVYLTPHQQVVIQK